MKTVGSKKVLLPLGAAILLALSVSSALAGTAEFELDKGDDGKIPAKKERGTDPDSPAWHRQLWTGSFDTASDAAGAAARQLKDLEFECDKYEGKNEKLFAECERRKQASANFASQARSIQSQQKAMSMFSKASDLAAVGAVGGVIYGEMGVKTGNQANTYESAANIERIAGQASYATGAADLTMGAYAYVAQKNKLEQMKATLADTKNGVKSNVDSSTISALANAAEAAKKAAYSHMMWGAGKLAAGYGMMYVAKQSQAQADRMNSISDAQFVNAQAVQQAAAAGTLPAQPGGVPYYQSNAPQFTYPNAAGTSLAAPVAPTVNYGLPGGGTGSSAPIGGAAARSVASAIAGAKGGGGSGGSSGKGGDLEPMADDKAVDKNAKEAMGSSFEMQLTGGLHSFTGGGSAAAKDETPNLAALLNPGGDASAHPSAATGLSPAQLMRDAREGAEGDEQGSMAGVSGKSEVSLFDITKMKLTKMFQIGNVGIPKTVEVKN